MVVGSRKDARLGCGTYVAEEPPSSSGSVGKIKELSWATVTGLGVRNTHGRRGNTWLTVFPHPLEF